MDIMSSGSYIYEKSTSFHFTSIQTLVTTKAKSMVGRKHDSMVITVELYKFGHNILMTP